MSDYVKYYCARKIMYRDFASRWMKWADGVELSQEDREGVSLFFKSIAVRFGLIKEFKCIGVI
jgi:hypothetical protein